MEQGLTDAVEFNNNTIAVKDISRVRDLMDSLIYNAVFESDDEKRKSKFILVKEICKAAAQCSSIQGLLRRDGKNYPDYCACDEHQGTPL
jgi:hypothetical protein